MVPSTSTATSPSSSRNSVLNKPSPAPDIPVRKHLGYSHIRGRFAKAVDRITSGILTEYLNFHRPCHFPTESVGCQGKAAQTLPLPGHDDSVRRDFPPQVGAVIQMGGEGVEFVLHAGECAEEHERNQPGEWEFTVAEKGGGFKANRVEQFLGVKVGNEGAQNVQEFKSPLSFILIES